MRERTRAAQSDVALCAYFFTIAPVVRAVIVEVEPPTDLRVSEATILAFIQYNGHMSVSNRGIVGGVTKTQFNE